MRGNERLHQTNQRLQRLYINKRNLFRHATETVTDGLMGEIAVGFAESGARRLTPEGIVDLFLSRVKELSPVTHDTLQRDLTDLATPIGKLCTLRLLEDVRGSSLSYSYVEDVTVTESGLLPQAKMLHIMGYGLMYPALEIAGQNLDPDEGPFVATSPPTDELGRRCTLSWGSVRAIEVH